MKTIVAIDPGSSGGVAVCRFGKVECWPMPETQGDVLQMLKELHAEALVEAREVVCVLERVSGFAGKAQPGSAMFRFGENFGFIKGVVQTLGIRLVLVRPQVWQRGFGLGTASACASKTEWKNKLKAEAQRRFPQLKVTLKTADALLILEHAGGACTHSTAGGACTHQVEPGPINQAGPGPINQAGPGPIHKRKTIKK